MAYVRAHLNGASHVTTGLDHALELSERTATLYLTGELTAADAFRLRGVCREIPEQVRILRVDLHGVVRIDGGGATRRAAALAAALLVAMRESKALLRRDRHRADVLE
jgi:ABC-type transporter Mla MlaB component